VGAQPAYGILINEVSGALDLSEIDFFQQGQALRLEPPDGKVIMAVNIDKFRADSGTYGMVFGGNNTGLIGWVNVTNSWTAGNTNQGVLIQGAETKDFAGFHFHHVDSLLNGKEGFKIASPTTIENLSITDCTVSGNSVSSHGTYDGIQIGPNIGNFKITGTKSGQITTLSGLSNNYQQYGISIQNGTGSNFVVMGNDLLGNTAGGLANSATGSGQVIKDNLGATFRMENISSSTNLVDKTDPINTVDKYLGKAVWDNLTSKFVYATGSAATDVWNDAVGALAHTPI
jgi:hypothetical protein